LAYCTVSDLVAIFGEADIMALTNRQPELPSTVDAALAQAKLDQAESEVNMYLAGRYALPLPSVPVVLKQITADIARFHLYTRIDETHAAYQAYTRRIKALEGIARGVLSLGLDALNMSAKAVDTVQIAPGRNDFGGRDW
jgi:phage gp36-like protein